MASQSERSLNSPAANSLQRIAVLLPLSAHWSGQLMRGIAAFPRRKRTWHVQRFGPSADGADSVRSWDPHGVVAFFAGDEPPPAVARLTAPIVAVNSGATVPGLPSVSVDRYSVGKTAAEHFSRRGVINYGCLTHPRISGGEQCCRGYAEFVRVQKDCRSLVYCAPRPATETDALVSLDAEFRNWLKMAPKPLGLFAVNDRLASEASQVCRELGLRVPQEVALLGADDDETICQICDPLLSSVRIAFPQVGYEAARMLDGLLAGRRPAAQPVLLRPIGVTVRHSCDACNVDDPEIAQVLRLIYGSTGQPLGMPELLKSITMSRRTLEQRFRAVLGRSPEAEVRRVSLQRAARLLVDSDEPIAAIACTCGFTSAATFSVAFSRRHAMSPRAFRNHYRGNCASAGEQRRAATGWDAKHVAAAKD